MLWNILNTRRIVGITQWLDHSEMLGPFHRYPDILNHCLRIWRFPCHTHCTVMYSINCNCPHFSRFILAHSPLSLLNIFSFPDDAVDQWKLLLKISEAVQASFELMSWSMLLYENIKCLLSKQLVPSGMELGSKSPFFPLCTALFKTLCCHKNHQGWNVFLLFLVSGSSAKHQKKHRNFEPTFDFGSLTVHIIKQGKW